MIESPEDIDLGFPPAKQLSGEELVEKQREMMSVLAEGYAPHIHEWHETVHERQDELWGEMRTRADTEEPECPECGEQRWAQVPGDPVYCRACGYEGRRDDEKAVHEVWDTIQEEARESDAREGHSE